MVSAGLLSWQSARTASRNALIAATEPRGSKKSTKLYGIEET
jgi:hypothetical protein